MKADFRHILWVFFAITLLLTGCRNSNPVQNLIESDLKNVPEWTILLEDMKEVGFFSSDYYHKYKILAGTGDTTQTRFNEEITDWIEVSPRFYRENENFLGMALASKVPGQEQTDTAIPPGYQYVGDSRYGRWRQDENGNSFWEFYGKYALFRDLLFGSSTPGMFGGRRHIDMDDYQSYRRNKDSRRPYYGKNGQFGTYGEQTQKTKPSFFERKKTSMQQRQSNFSNRVKSRMGRTSRSSSSRSFGRGK